MAFLFAFGGAIIGSSVALLLNKKTNGSTNKPENKVEKSVQKVEPKIEVKKEKIEIKFEPHIKIGSYIVKYDHDSKVLSFVLNDEKIIEVNSENQNKKLRFGNFVMQFGGLPADLYLLDGYYIQYDVGNIHFAIDTLIERHKMKPK